jgi:hypothetical protein
LSGMGLFCLSRNHLYLKISDVQPIAKISRRGPAVHQRTTTLACRRWFGRRG